MDAPSISDVPEDEVLATLEQYKNFASSSVWEDFSGVLKRRLTLYEQALRTCTAEDLPGLQSGLAELEFFMLFPVRMIEVLSEPVTEEEDNG